MKERVLDVTRFGPNRGAADMKEMEHLICGDLGGFLETFLNISMLLKNIQLSDKTSQK